VAGVSVVASTPEVNLSVVGDHCVSVPLEGTHSLVGQVDQAPAVGVGVEDVDVDGTAHVVVLARAVAAERVDGAADGHCGVIHPTRPALQVHRVHDCGQFGHGSLWNYYIRK